MKNKGWGHVVDLPNKSLKLIPIVSKLQVREVTVLKKSL